MRPSFQTQFHYQKVFTLKDQRDHKSERAWRWRVSGTLYHHKTGNKFTLDHSYYQEDFETFQEAKAFADAYTEEVRGYLQNDQASPA